MMIMSQGLARPQDMVSVHRPILSFNWTANSPKRAHTHTHNPVFPSFDMTFCGLCNYAAVGREAPACRALIALQVHTSARLIYMATRGRETRCNVPLFQL